MAPKKKTRKTRQRVVILEELKKLKTHPSASEIYEAVKRRLPKISMGTVYRNLQLLHDSGEIVQLGTSDSQKRFDHNVHDHDHILCVSCGRIEDIYPEEPLELERKISSKTEFTIYGHFLEFQGLCPECKKQEESD